jgi:hypothetical protein
VTEVAILTLDFHFDTEDIADQFCRKYRGGFAESYQLPAFHDSHAVTEHSGVVEIMEGRNDSQALLVYEMQQRDLMPDI